MAEKKFFVDINLQGNKLVNPVVGSNGSMTTAGSFQYNAGRLEYYNGSTVEEVANLNDIAAVTGGLILQGGYNASTNTPDIAADSSVLKGFFWVVTAAGSFLGEAVQVGDSIIAKQDNPGATAANWLILQGNVVIATDSVDGISRLATQAEADAGTEGGAVVITPATLQGKIDAQVTPEINNKLPLAGGTMTGTINMNGNAINNISDITVGVISNVGSDPIEVYNIINANNGITNLAAPTNGSDAANKTYVDDQDALKVSKSGDTMSGNLDMGANQITNASQVNASTIVTDAIDALTGPITVYAALLMQNSNLIQNLGTPVNGGDAANKTYVDDNTSNKLPLAGGTMSGNIDMNGNSLEGASDVSADSVTVNNAPIFGTNATNKDYVDNAVSTAQSNAESFATSAANTAESNANAYTDTAIASTNKSATLFGSSSGSSSWNLVNYDGVPTYMASVDDNFNTQHKSVTTMMDNSIVEFTVVVFPNTTYIYSNIEPSYDTLITILR